MTLVVDASAVAEILVGSARGSAAALLLADHVLIAPSHLSAEVASVVRGWSLGGHVTDDQALALLADFVDLGVEPIDMADLLPEVWSLRHNLTAYDALYVVLARATDCRLLTLDSRLASAAPDCALLPQVGDGR